MSRTRVLVVVLALGLSVAAAPSAQVPVESPGLIVTEWGVLDGLPVAAVRQVIHTREGYLWLATHDGLVRFDGNRFTVFDASNTPALPSSRVDYLYETADGTIWIHLEGRHLVRYRDGAFERYRSSVHFDGDPVTIYHLDPDRGLWVGTPRGLYQLVGDRFERFRPDVLRDRPVAFYHGIDGAFWVGTEGSGAFRFKAGRLTARSQPAGAAPSEVSAIWQSPDATVWLRTEKRVAAFSRGARSISLEAWADRLDDRLGVAVQRLREPRSLDYFLYAPGQPDLYDFAALSALPHLVTAGPRGHEWFHVGDGVYRDGVQVFRATDYVNSLAFDDDGTLWVASLDGLYRLSQAPFTSYDLQGATPAATASAYGVMESRDGAIWAAVMGPLAGGIVRLADGRATTVRVTEMDGIPLARTLHQEPNGAIWVGLLGGVCRIAPSESDVCRRVRVPGLTDQTPVHAITRHRGTLWLGTESGVYHRERAASAERPARWRRYTTADGLSHDVVRGFLTDRHGALWMGTYGGGLTRLLRGEFSALTEANGLSSNTMRALFQDDEGVLWAGTEAHGLNRVTLDDATGLPISVMTIREADGLSDDGIHQILEDDQRRFWMSTNQGVFHVERDNLAAFADGRAPRVFATAYDERHGMISREGNGGVQSPGVRARDGRLWFPTQQGLVVVDPSTAAALPGLPPTLIETVRYADTTAIRPASVTLPVGVRRLELTFTSPAFRNPEAVRFRYRLGGHEDDWIDAGTSRTAIYTNVPPGRYTFEVMASNAPSAWPETGTTVAVRVLPRIYETWWFALVLGLGLLGVAFAWLRQRGLRQRRREVELEATVHARTADLAAEKETVAAQAEDLKALDLAKSQLFANVSHEFRTPLTLSIGPLVDMLDGHHGKIGGLRQHLDGVLLNNRRLLRMVNQLLDVARLEAHSMDTEPRELDLAAFTRDMAAAYAPLAERKRIELTTQVPGAPLTMQADPDHLDKILSNLLSNAFKFTPQGGRVDLSVSAEAETAVVRVTDTGVGIAAGDLPHVFERFFRADKAHSTLGSGIGLSLVEQLVSLHGGTVSVQSVEGEGATFTVRLSTAGPRPAESLGRPSLPSLEQLTGSTQLTGDGGWMPIQYDEDADAPAEDQDRTTVLVVDDNTDVRAYVRSQLEASYRVREAADGVEALLMARAEMPDLIVSDVTMPEMDGFELLAALRRDPDLAVVPVILLTARAEHADKLHGLERGADDYLIKPFASDELRARVDSLIQSRQRLRTYYQGDGAPPGDVGASTGDRDEVPTTGTSVTAAPPQPAEDPSVQDDIFVARAEELARDRLSDPDFGVQEWADALGADRSHLYRSVREAAEVTPQALLRRLRLERAAEMLAAGAGSVGEVAYGVGFNSLSYFSRAFKAHTGQTPSAYAKLGAKR